MAATSPAVLLSIRNHLLAEKYYDLATCVMILYDHSLTLDMEVENIWMQKRSFPKYLWFVFRYGAPLIQVGSVFGDLLQWSEKACLRWIWVRIIAIQIIFLALNFIIILRIWALFERARWVIIVMLVALLGQTIVTIWSYDAITATVMFPMINGCLPIPKPGRAGQGASIFISLLATEMILFILSIFRIAKLAANRSLTMPLVQILLRDGVPYLFIICVVNIGNVILLELPRTRIPTELETLNTEITPVLMVIMVSRLFLNLRASANESSDHDFTLVGNLGAPVQYDDGRIEIRVTMDCVTYTDDGGDGGGGGEGGGDGAAGSVALEELQAGRRLRLPYGHQRRKEEQQYTYRQQR